MRRFFNVNTRILENLLTLFYTYFEGITFDIPRFEKIIFFIPLVI